MRRFIAIEYACIAYLLISMVYMRFGYNTPFWSSLYDLKEHLFSIGLLLFLIKEVNNSIGKLIVMVTLLFNVEMVIFNLIAINLTLPDYVWACRSEYISIGIMLSILTSIIICKKL